jgi:hypothetical protein
MSDDRQAQADQVAENLKRANEEFIRDTPGVHPIGKAEPDGKYGHPFHDKVAAYINDANTNAKLKDAFMEGFHGQQRARALDYLRSAGIINASTPTSRINEFLAAWNIQPLPDQESDDVTQVVREVVDVSPSAPVNVGEVTMVSPNQDDEIVDAEIIEDDG